MIIRIRPERRQKHRYSQQKIEIEREFEELSTLSGQIDTKSGENKKNPRPIDIAITVCGGHTRFNDSAAVILVKREKSQSR